MAPQGENLVIPAEPVPGGQVRTSSRRKWPHDKRFSARPFPGRDLGRDPFARSLRCRRQRGQMGRTRSSGTDERRMRARFSVPSGLVRGPGSRHTPASSRRNRCPAVKSERHLGGFPVGKTGKRSPVMEGQTRATHRAHRRRRHWKGPYRGAERTQSSGTDERRMRAFFSVPLGLVRGPGSPSAR